MSSPGFSDRSRRYRRCSVSSLLTSSQYRAPFGQYTLLPRCFVLHLSSRFDSADRHPYRSSASSTYVHSSRVLCISVCPFIEHPCHCYTSSLPRSCQRPEYIPIFLVTRALHCTVTYRTTRLSITSPRFILSARFAAAVFWLAPFGHLQPLILSCPSAATVDHLNAASILSSPHYDAITILLSITKSILKPSHSYRPVYNRNLRISKYDLNRERK